MTHPSGGGKTRLYQFSIPNLPKRTYLYVKELSEIHEVTFWHVMLMALKALSHLSEEQQALLKVEIVKKYPYPGSPSCR